MRILVRRDSQMAMCVAAVLLVSNVAVLAQTPDNAALLYYQAFLLYEEPNQPMRWMLSDFRKGEIVSNEAIAQHIEKNRLAIHYAVKAADISKCDWGHDYSQGINMLMTNLSPLNRIASLLAVEARLLAEQGDYIMALGRCVTLRKIALHACDRTLTSYLLGRQVSGTSNEAIQYVLGITPGDVDQLTQLKSNLTQTEERFPLLVPYLTGEAQIWVAAMQKDKMRPLVDMYEGSLGGDLLEPMLDRIRKGDDTFFKRNREYYLNAMATVVGTLESGLPYAQTCAKLDGLVKQWIREADNDPDATLTTLLFPPAARSYQLMVRHQTHLNAVKTAINLYIIKARTGQLPDSLPADCPPDLFSGKPFAYVNTAEGFILRCQGKENPNKDEQHEYEFKAK